jgi:pectate lyase
MPHAREVSGAGGFAAIPAAVILFGLWPVGSTAARAADANGKRYLDAVVRFADRALQSGRDVYGPQHTPLFVDGLEVATGKPVEWPIKKEVWIPANLASQQTLLRVLDGLTGLGEPTKYREAAVAAVRFGFEHLRGPNGLLYWGGHTSYDALGDKMVTEAGQHELKRHYPYYELMWQVDPQATRRFVEAFWAGHVQDWAVLDFNRHGSYQAPVQNVWDHPYSGGPVFFTSRGLTFVNTGSDLFYAAAWLGKLSGNEKPLTWAKRLAQRYVETRNPQTSLGGYTFSKVISGDRAVQQFGPEFGDRINEGTIVDSLRAPTKFAAVGCCQLLLGELLGDGGREFLQWGCEDLRAYGRHAYRAADNAFLPMITDGGKLTPADVKRSGYYGPPDGVCFQPLPADPRFLRAYALAWRLSGDAFCWQMARAIARGNDLGDLGEQPGQKPSPNRTTSCSHADAVIALVDIHQRTGNAAYLELACKVADNLLAAHFDRDLFIDGREYRFARLDRHEPLALLHLVAALRGQRGRVPTYWAGDAFFACRYGNGGRKYDSEAIYTQRKP